jgi:ribose transport system permease protein
MCSWLYGYTYTDSFRAISAFRVPMPVIGNLHFTTVVMVVAVVILEILLKKAAVFRQMYYVGENLETARIYGIRAGRQKIVIFTVMSLLSGIGGILLGSRLSYAHSTTGEGLEFTILTAVVLGGASLSGGKGSILRAVVGLIFLATISTGMIVHNIDPLIQQLIVGIILIATVFIDTRMGKIESFGASSKAAKAGA